MSDRIRVAYFNVQSALGATSLFKRIVFDWKFYLPHSQKPLKDIRDILNSEQIDIASFVEINGKCLRSNYLDQISEMTCGTALENHQFFSSYKLAGIINQGIGIATKYQILRRKQFILPGGIEKRSLGEVEIRTPSEKITVFSTHLSLGENARKQQIEYLAERVKEIEGLMIIIGDLNTRNAEELTPLLDKGKLTLLNSLPTYPSWNPRYCLGRILHSPKLKPLVCKSYTKNLVSDHLPLIVDFKIS